MLTLFYAPGACSLAPHIALEEAGLAFGTKRMNLAQGDQRQPEYLAVNPRGMVPALVTPDGLITECPAVLTYVAEAAPAAGLLPEGAFARAQAFSLMAWLSSHVHVAFAHIFRPSRFTDQDSADAGMKAKSLSVIPAAFAELDARLAGREWLFERYSVVDPHAQVFRGWAARLGIDLSPYAHFSAQAARLAQRPAAQRAYAREGLEPIA